MFNIKENNLEWSLKHFLNFYDSDFFPRLFEFQAIAHNWEQVKKYLLTINLENFQPKSPFISLAPKPNGNYRIVHQLDPIDSLIYASLIREVCEVVESYRIPESEDIACSYRIKPDMEGSFFQKNDDGWQKFKSKSEELAIKYKGGFVIVADITDFYNQIYTHRICGLIEEAGQGAHDDLSVVLEKFILGLNKKTSRGIPVGPAPSIIISELIMADIDRKIKNYTNDFVRYVDDIRIYLKFRENAVYVLHELTKHLYSYHRLVFSGEKTKIISTEKFLEKYLKDEEKEENAAIIAKTEELALEKLNEQFDLIDDYNFVADPEYGEEYERILIEISKNKQFEILSSTYYELFTKSLLSDKPDYAFLRHLLRKATRYRFRNLMPVLLENFEKVLPVLRESVIYLRKIINEKSALDHKSIFEQILNAHYMQLPFVNLWISYLFQKEVFNEINLSISYDLIQSTRNQALIAHRSKDTTWVKDFRDGIDVLGPWDKRAVLYSSSILSSDEAKVWAGSVATSGDIIDKSIAALLTLD